MLVKIESDSSAPTIDPLTWNSVYQWKLTGVTAWMSILVSGNIISFYIKDFNLEIEILALVWNPQNYCIQNLDLDEHFLTVLKRIFLQSWWFCLPFFYLLSQTPEKLVSSHISFRSVFFHVYFLFCWRLGCARFFSQTSLENNY